MTAGDLVPLRPPAPVARFTPARPPQAADDVDGVQAARAVARLLDLAQTLDPAAALLARGCLPRRDSTCGAGLALFLTVTAAGCRDWLGPVAAEIAALDDGLLLAECDRLLAPHFRRVDGRLWRVSRVPLLDGAGGLLCATSVEDGPAEAFTLVLQTRLRTLGPVQVMATMVRRRLDVTLRAGVGLPASLLVELHDSVGTALEDCGCDGGLTVGPLSDGWLGLDGAPSSDLAV